MDQQAIIGAIALFGLGIFGYTRMILKGRSTGKLKDILPKAKIIDVRTAAEFKEARFPGAVNIPVDRLSKSAKKLGDPSEPVVVYCASGSRARQAARALRMMGYRKVHVGGTLASMNKLVQD